MRCKFDLSWGAKCGNETFDAEDYCLEHRVLKCACCGEKATRTCDQTLGPFICGSPLCDNCTHEKNNTGAAVNALKHVRKG